MTLLTTPTMTGLFMPSPAPTRINQKNVPNYMFIAVQCANVSESQCSGTNILQFWSELCIWTTTSQTLKLKSVFIAAKDFNQAAKYSVFKYAKSMQPNICTGFMIDALEHVKVWRTHSTFAAWGKSVMGKKLALERSQSGKRVYIFDYVEPYFDVSLSYIICSGQKSHNNKSWATQQLW